MISQQFFLEQSSNFILLVLQSGFLSFLNGLLRIDELIFNYFSPKIAIDMREI